MDTRQRNVYVTAKQKRKLIELLAQHPELISCKVTQDFNYRDSQKLWHNISNQCNAIPGAKKTWRQWRKTWQDIRCKTKKQINRGEIPASVALLSTAELEALGLKTVSGTLNYQNSTEFVPLDGENVQDSFDNDMGSTASFSEPESPLEDKTYVQSQLKSKKIKHTNKINSNHSNTCIFNCDALSIQEQKKVQIKEDYYRFKIDYLKQKLIIMKEQTETLKTIAKELAK